MSGTPINVSRLSLRAQPLRQKLYSFSQIGKSTARTKLLANGNAIVSHVVTHGDQSIHIYGYRAADYSTEISRIRL